MITHKYFLISRHLSNHRSILKIISYLLMSYGSPGSDTFHNNSRRTVGIDRFNEDCAIFWYLSIQKIIFIALIISTYFQYKIKSNFKKIWSCDFIKNKWKNIIIYVLMLTFCPSFSHLYPPCNHPATQTCFHLSQNQWQDIIIFVIFA